MQGGQTMRWPSRRDGSSESENLGGLGPGDVQPRSPCPGPGAECSRVTIKGPCGEEPHSHASHIQVGLLQTRGGPPPPEP